MKKITILLTSLVLAMSAHAVQISGSLTIAGGATLDEAIGTADEVSTWVTPLVQSRSGDFETTVAVGQAVTMTQPWIFNPSTPVANLWTVGGFSFSLTSSTIVTQSADFLIVSGIGSITGNNFDATTGVWRFTTQSPSANGIFSFSASTAAQPAPVPDAGSSVALLGLALVSFGVLRRKLS